MNAYSFTHIVENAVALKRLTNEIIEREIKARKSDFNGDAINWGDLSCHEAAYVISDDGESYWQVTIEEASPSSGKLCQEVRRLLKKSEWDVDVRAEW